MPSVSKKTKSKSKAQVSKRMTATTLAEQSAGYFKRFIWPSIALVSILFLVYLHHLILFPITSVRVYDPGLHIAEQSIIDTVNPLVDNGFFGTRLYRIKNALEALPWVAEVNVSRQWPGKIIIHLYERTPVASWNQKDLVTADGVIFTPATNDVLPPLPHLSGPPAEVVDMVQVYPKLEQEIAPLQLTITDVHLSERLSWDLRLSNGMIVKLGRDEIFKRLARLVKVYPQVFANNENKAIYVDLRYSHGMAVRWADTQNTG